jgi:hypothetical protein
LIFDLDRREIQLRSNLLNVFFGNLQSTKSQRRVL